MLHLYHSNHQTVLSELLTAQINVNPPPHPFAKTTVIVQSDGMANWLKLQLANRRGITSNIDFVMPSNFLWQCYRNALPDIPERSPLSREQLPWRILQALEHFLEHPEFEHLAAFCEGQLNTRKAFELATEIADIYDGYLMYRTDWLADWERGQTQLHTENQPWQGLLWQHIISTLDASTAWHRGSIAERFLRTTLSTTELPSALFIFGVNTIPPIMLTQLLHLANFTELHIFLQMPTDQYWAELQSPSRREVVVEQLEAELKGDIVLGYNRLLASWGQQGRLFNLQLLRENVFDAMTQDIYIAPEQMGQTALNTLQQHIFDLEDLPRINQDTSIQFAQCHSVLREVQSLHDYLLGLLEQDPDLTPDEIIVLVTDAEQYMPIINAVFNSQPHHRRLPIALSDRRNLEEMPVYQALSQLLMVSKTRLTLENVFDLLSLECIARSFDLAVADTDLLQSWCQQVNIHWGYDAKHWKSIDITPTHRHDWSSGLERLLLGSVMDSGMGGWCNISSGPRISSTDLPKLGRFIEFIRELGKLIVKHQAAMTVPEIERQTLYLCDTFISPIDQENEHMQRIREGITTFFEAIHNTGYNEVLCFNDISPLLKRTLTDVRNSQRFASGRLNVCTFLPMRSIPFKGVCMLGMNDQSFPRRQQPQSFDLMRHSRRIGDRTPAQEDRYLFLEAILSANKNLYISWCGLSLETNDSLPPSILVAELLSYLEPDSEQQSRWIHRHRLHPFAEDYYDGSGVPQSFDTQWLLDQSTPQAFLAQPIEPIRTGDIQIEQLRSFANHPARYFLRQLGIQAELWSEQWSDDEPLGLNGLTRWQQNQQLLEQLRHQGNVQHWAEHLNRSGQLPGGGLGERIEQQRLTEALESQALWTPLLTSIIEPKNIQLSLNGHSIVGALPISIVDNQFALVQYEFQPVAKISVKQRLLLRLQQLIANASGIQAQAIIATQDQLLVASPLSPTSAQQWLTDFIDLFVHAERHGLALTPTLAQAIAKGTAIGSHLDDVSFQRLIQGDPEWLDKVTPWVEHYLIDSLTVFKEMK